MKHKKLMAILVLCMIFAFSFGVAAEEPVFSDIDGHWAADAIMTAYSYGVVNGNGDGTFNPEGNLTRGQFAVIMYNLQNADISVPADANTEEAVLPFSDVPETHYAYNAIKELYSEGIIKGVTENTFCPDQAISRQDVAVILYRIDQIAEDPISCDSSKNIAEFDDVGAISKYAVHAMNFCYQAGIFNGYNNCIAPLSNITRGEIAQVVANLIDLQQNPPLPVYLSQEQWSDAKQSVDISTGTTMTYIEMGDRDGEDFLLIHGASDSSRSWSLMVEYIARAGYHVWVPDMRGHGDTATNGMARIENGMLVEDVVAFMDAVGIERANIMGHSRGGKIVELFAQNYPEKVYRLISESAAGVGTTNTEGGSSTFYWDAPFDKLPINGPYDDGTYQWDNYMDYWYYNDNPVDEDFLAMAKYEASWLPLESWRAIGGSLKQAQELNDEIPFMALYGELDYLIDVEWNKDLHETQYGELLDESIMMEGFGHNMHYEDAEKIAEYVLDFCDEYEAAEVEVDKSYEVGEKEEAPIAATGLDPAEYYDEDGRLDTQLDSIPQGDWVNFKHYVELDSGITMAYIEMGNPDGEPLVLIHGMTDSSRSWSSIVSYFADDYHLYIPDQRGHGDTDKPAMCHYDRSLYAYDLKCFMDEMGLEKASLMGHSLGSMNLQAFAMDYPDYCDKIVLESTMMIGTNSETAAEAWSDYDLDSPANEGKEWSDILTWSFIEWWYYNDQPVPEVFHQMMMADCYNYPQENWTFLFPADYQARIIANHNIDTLVLYGSTDYLMGGSTQTTVKEQMEEAYEDSEATYEYKSYEGNGHNIHWEIPETIYNDVNDFLTAE